MEIKDVVRYPRLEGDQVLMETMELVQIKQKKITILIEEIQRNCPHKNEQNNTSEYRYKPTFVEKILDSKTCLDCGHVEERPKGMRWEICYICWGPMKDAGTEPGQGGRTFHYECTKCGHHESHT